MKKIKLILARNSKGFSQEYVALSMCMSVSNYSRKENGQVKIKLDEWERLCKLLEINFEEIFETDSAKSSDEEQSVVSHCEECPLPKEIIHYKNKYISLLEAEIERLKNNGVK